MPPTSLDMERCWTMDGALTLKKDRIASTHPTKPGIVTIPFHKGRELPKRTVNSIRKQAGLK